VYQSVPEELDKMSVVAQWTALYSISHQIHRVDDSTNAQ